MKKGEWKHRALLAEAEMLASAGKRKRLKRFMPTGWAWSKEYEEWELRDAEGRCLGAVTVYYDAVVVTVQPTPDHIGKGDVLGDFSGRGFVAAAKAVDAELLRRAALASDSDQLANNQARRGVDP